jgi:isocitrate dehydrogenase kinase/phosphatase
VVRFLKSIIPLKRIAELYISIGYNKHGKTELYRDLMHHMAYSVDSFEIARGEKGMVMVVFTLPSYDIVFKVIKDRVSPPKDVTRFEVMERYDLVFKHDRVGRLVDAQEFEYLRFERKRFNQELLDELLEYAPNAVSLEDGWVVLKHLYTERRLTPLNLFIKEAPQTAAIEAVLDYGHAIKDLAAANIFPGDVLLKNFGVTRHGRIVFYDYDELCLVTDCTFRSIPQARSFDDEFSSEPWFYVGPMDIFPEEFHTFLGLPEPLHSIFIEHHGDLFGVDFWRKMQARHNAGQIVETFPYPADKHLKALDQSL